MSFYDLRETGQVRYTTEMAFSSHLLEAGYAFLENVFGIPIASAQAWMFNINVCTLFAGTAPCINLPNVQGQLFDFFIKAAFEVCTGILLLGCLFMVLSGGSQTLLEKGKSIIKGSLIAYAVIGGSFIILRAITWLLYSG